MSFSHSLLHSLAQSQIIEKHPLIVNAEVFIPEVISLMNQQRTSCALVAEQQRLIGIFTERDVVKLTATQMIQPNVPIQAVMTQEVISVKISVQTDIFSLVSLLRNHRIRHLPVVDELNQIVGLITPSQIRDLLKPADLLKFKPVVQLMTTQIFHESPTASIIDIARQMAHHQISCIVIAETINGGDLIPVGVITERDIVQLQTVGVDLAATTAAQVMTQPLQTIQPDDSLWTANEIMKEHGIRRLVVVDPAGKIAGLLTQTRLLEALNPIEMSAMIEVLQEQVETQTAQLSKVNEQLQQELRDRAQLQEQLLLQNIQLQQALLDAQAADIAKRNFLATLNHELRTPLHAILGFSYLMNKAGPLSLKQQNYLAQILSSGESLLRLIDNLLEIAQIELDINFSPIPALARKNFIPSDWFVNIIANHSHPTKTETINLSDESLVNLPNDWLVSLHQAIIEGDLDWALRIIAQIREQNEPVGTALATLATQLQFEELLSLTARKEENKSL